MTLEEITQRWGRKRTSDDLTTDQRERLQIVAVSGGADSPDRMLAQRRLEFARTLWESGVIGHQEVRDGKR